MISTWLLLGFILVCRFALINGYETGKEYTIAENARRWGSKLSILKGPDDRIVVGFPNTESKFSVVTLRIDGTDISYDRSNPLNLTQNLPLDTTITAIQDSETLAITTSRTDVQVSTDYVNGNSLDVYKTVQNVLPYLLNGISVGPIQITDTTSNRTLRIYYQLNPLRFALWDISDETRILSCKREVIFQDAKFFLHGNVLVMVGTHRGNLISMSFALDFKARSVIPSDLMLLNVSIPSIRFDASAVPIDESSLWIVVFLPGHEVRMPIIKANVQVENSVKYQLEETSYAVTSQKLPKLMQLNSTMLMYAYVHEGGFIDLVDIESGLDASDPFRCRIPWTDRVDVVTFDMAVIKNNVLVVYQIFNSTEIYAKFLDFSTGCSKIQVEINSENSTIPMTRDSRPAGHVILEIFGTLILIFAFIATGVGGYFIFRNFRRIRNVDQGLYSRTQFKSRDINTDGLIYRPGDSDVSIDENSGLGSGRQSQVYKGSLVAHDGTLKLAAFKKLKSVNNENNEEKAEKEAKTLSRVGDHPNCVQLYGRYSHANSHYLIFEYFPLGNLRKFLKSDTHEFRVLLKLAIDVCRGMSHVSKKGIVHGDLAARNILIRKDPKTQEFIAKIADFGMSIPTGSHVTAVEIPFRWCAIETLREERATHASDVWSYAVLLWEIFSRGETPFGEKATSASVKKRLEKGGKLSKPGDCPEEIWDLMLRCWQFSPESRPSFESIQEILEKIRDGDANQIAGDDVDNDISLTIVIS